MEAHGAHEKFAEYNLIKNLGQGCLGRVFLAQHLFMKNLFALKLLPQELTSRSGFLERFQGDIASISRLEHPSIARIHQVAQTDGHYYIVTEPVLSDSEAPLNLSQYLKKRQSLLSEEEIFNLLMQLASALDYAHQMRSEDGSSLAHLSLRPSNILVTERMGQIRFMLTDFGLHRILGSGHILRKILEGVSADWDDFEDEKALESAQSFKVAYHCMAPEQKDLLLAAQDPQNRPGPASDVYSFGAIAYYLLCGEFPEGVFELPSLRRSDLRYNWDRMIMACLAMKPSKRPRNLVNLLEAVRISCLLEEDDEEEEEETISSAPTYQSPPIAKDPFQKPFPSKQVAPPPPSAPQSAPPNFSRPGTLNQGRSLQEYEAPIRPVAAASQVSQDCRPAAPRPLPGAGYINPPYSPPAPKGGPPFAAKEPIGVQHAFSSTSNELAGSNPANNPDFLEKGISSTSPPVVISKISKGLDPEAEMGPTPMVTVQGGRHLRGSNDGSRDEMPRHAVVIGDFALDVHPVSNEQFVQFLKTISGEKDENNNDIIRLKESRIKRVGGKLLIEPGYNRHPVVGVTWYGAQAYCKWIGKRLPTEAEWEIAARGGFEEAVYPSGDDIEKSQANFFNSDTTAVMSYPPNAYGLYDMAGNVYEWCQDWYAYNTYELTASEPMYPQGPLQGVYRVLRGGCWKSLKEDLRCAHRHRNNPGAVNRTYGFRCASDSS